VRSTCQRPWVAGCDSWWCKASGTYMRHIHTNTATGKVGHNLLTICLGCLIYSSTREPQLTHTS
jgi:hypothetical protein